MQVQNTVNQNVYVNLLLHLCDIKWHGIVIAMLGLFTVVTYVEQLLLVLPNTAGKKKLYGSNTCFIFSQPTSFLQKSSGKG